eukprot:170259_1
METVKSYEQKYASNDCAEVELEIMFNDPETAPSIDRQKQTNLSLTDKKNYMKFVGSQKADYMDCQHNDHHISDCKVLKRIIHLLSYYSQQQLSIYEYISTLKYYDVPRLMEDWHQTKINHLRDEQNIEWIRMNFNICNGIKRCKYLDRYQRKRGNALDIDYKDVILMDQLDSIHIFIFHSSLRRNKIKRKNIIFQESDINEQEEEKYTDYDIWSKKPQSIHGCNLEQILWIVENEIFDKLPPNVTNKIIQYKTQIIEYMKHNKLDGYKLAEMKRKRFATELKKYLKNSKLNAPLAVLYSTIIKYDVSNVMGNNQKNITADIWIDKPSSIQQCSVEQILYILKEVMDDKLSGYRNDIVKYFEKRQLNGNKLSSMSRKQFVNQLTDYMNNNKFEDLLEKLYKNIIHSDLSSFYSESSYIPIISNDKFITKMSSETEIGSTPGYYSFGQQYRYTTNLHHPLYVNPKYMTIKEELYEYFKGINEQGDLQILLHSQLHIIQSSKPTLQPILKQLLYEQQITDFEVLWIDSDGKFDDNNIDPKIMALVTSEDKSHKQLAQVYKICNYVKQILPKHTSFVLTNLLDIKLYHLQECIKSNLRMYFKDVENTINLKDKQYVINQALSVYADIFDNHAELQNYALSKRDRKQRINEIFTHQTHEQQHNTLEDSFCEMLQISKLQIYESIQKNLEHTPFLQRVAKEWADVKTNNKPLINTLTTVEERTKCLLLIFPIGCQKLQSETIKKQFTQYARRMIQLYQSQIELNRQKYIERRQNERSTLFIEKAETKIKMDSVKQMKACWYQGINNHHQVHPDQPMLIDHVLSLVLYTHCSELCTMLRETYRKIHDAETIDNQKNRHALFAHFGRLLYESFVFFGSTNYQSILYHGMSTQLLFKTLYCTFNAP